MKNTILVALLTLLVNPLFAQVKLGVKAGGLLSNRAAEGIRFNFPGASGDTKLSYLTGAVLAVPLSDRFSAQAELLYSKKGMRSGFVEARGQTSRATDNLHYLSVPLLLRYHLIEQLSIGLGPEVSYLLGAYQRSQVLGSRPNRMFYEPLDVAINLDVQYTLLDKVSLGLRYNVGVYDVAKRVEFISFGGNEPVVIDNVFYNRSLQLVLTYWLK